MNLFEKLKGKVSTETIAVAQTADALLTGGRTSTTDMFINGALVENSMIKDEKNTLVKLSGQVSALMGGIGPVIMARVSTAMASTPKEFVGVVGGTPGIKVGFDAIAPKFVSYAISELKAGVTSVIASIDEDTLVTRLLGLVIGEAAPTAMERIAMGSIGCENILTIRKNLSNIFTETSCPIELMCGLFIRNIKVTDGKYVATTPGNMSSEEFIERFSAFVELFKPQSSSNNIKFEQLPMAVQAEILLGMLPLVSIAPAAIKRAARVDKVAALSILNENEIRQGCAAKGVADQADAYIAAANDPETNEVFTLADNNGLYSRVLKNAANMNGKDSYMPLPLNLPATLAGKPAAYDKLTYEGVVYIAPRKVGGGNFVLGEVWNRAQYVPYEPIIDGETVVLCDGTHTTLQDYEEWLSGLTQTLQTGDVVDAVAEIKLLAKKSAVKSTGEKVAYKPIGTLYYDGTICIPEHYKIFDFTLLIADEQLFESMRVSLLTGADTKEATDLAGELGNICPFTGKQVTKVGKIKPADFKRLLLATGGGYLQAVPAVYEDGSIATQGSASVTGEQYSTVRHEAVKAVIGDLYPMGGTLLAVSTDGLCLPVGKN